MTSESADIKPALVQISAHLVASAFAPLAAVVARLDRATQYSVTPVIDGCALEYWATRFRGW
jgi:hypothetical protein